MIFEMQQHVSCRSLMLSGLGVRDTIRGLRKAFRALWIVLCVCLFAHVTAFAQSSALVDTGISQDTRDLIVELAEKIEREQLIKSDSDTATLEEVINLPSETALFELRSILLDILFLQTNQDAEAALKAYTDLANQSQSTRDKALASLFSEVFLYFDRDNVQSNLDVLTEVLNAKKTHEDWYLRHTAVLLQSVFNSYNLNTSDALELANQALSYIPEGGNEKDASYARARITLYLSYLHNLLRNPGLAADNTQQYIELMKELGETIDGVSLVNNLIYSLTNWREFETVSKLAEVVLRLEDISPSNTPGLSYMRISRIYNELRQYETALSHAENGLKLAEIQTIRSNLLIQKVIALAGMGNTSAATLSLRDFEAETPVDVQSRGNLARWILHARALLALGRNDSRQADILFAELRNAEILSILNSYQKDTNNLLVSLQNSKERQDEREAAFQRERALQAEAIEKSARLNKFLWLVLLVVVAGAVSFTVYRTKVMKQLSGALKQAKAGEKTKTEFLSVMSHELRTPLNGIMGMADYLCITAKSPDLKEKYEIIHQSGQDLLSLVENILDMTLIESDGVVLSDEPTNLTELTQEYDGRWREKIEQKGLQFTTHVEADVPELISIDQSRLRQIYDILLSNALKFTHEGRIHLHIKRENTAPGELAHIKIFLADTGVGISDAAKPHLFKAFVQSDSSITRQYGGAGLGLAIARSLSRMMNGDLTVDSREGKGSVFELSLNVKTLKEAQLPVPVPKSKRDKYSLPVRTPAPKPVTPTLPSDTANAKPSPNLTGVKVLVIEDDAASREVVDWILTSLGMKGYIVDSGREGLEALNQYAFDIVILDLLMPDIDGIKVANAVRKLEDTRSLIPIIAVTGDTRADTRQRCIEAGIDVLLTKPIIPAKLEHSLKYVMQYVPKKSAADKPQSHPIPFKAA